MVYDVALNKLMNMFLALGMAVLVMSVMALTYVDIWRSRKQMNPGRSGVVGVLRWWFYSIPWVATLTIVGLTAFGIFYSIYRMVYPPSDW